MVAAVVKMDVLPRHEFALGLPKRNVFVTPRNAYLEAS